MCKNQGITSKEKKIVKCFTVSEQEKIENYVKGKNNPEWFGIILCLYTGLRIGELLALTWDDIDFNNNELVVNKTTYVSLNERGSWQQMIDSPKSMSSERVIPLQPFIVKTLKEIRSKSLCNYVISYKNKHQMNTRTYRYRFNQMISELNLPNLSFHTLRHTFATRALESGMDIKTLSEILGHASASMTLNVYTHSMTNHKHEMINQMGQVMNMEFKY